MKQAVSVSHFRLDQIFRYNKISNFRFFRFPFITCKVSDVLKGHCLQCLLLCHTFIIYLLSFFFIQVKSLIEI